MTTGVRERSRSRWLAPLLLVAFAATVLHLAPFLMARHVTPPGWRFTGNVTSSVDLMQYRAWFRQTQVWGPLVPDHFTSEPNNPHVFVAFAYLVGLVARGTGVAPEFVYAYAGSVVAFILTILLFLTVRHFTGDGSRAWWIFLALLVGGGSGAHVKFLAHFDAIKNSRLANWVLFEPLTFWPAFEDYRGHYVFTTFFDTHFLVLWTAATATLLSLSLTLRRFTFGRLALTLVLALVTTLFHVYEGVTLIVIAASIAWLCWIKGLLDRRAVVTISATVVVLAGCLLWYAWLMANAGIPPPTWRAVMILPGVLFLAYPLAWMLLAWGFGRYWRNATLDGCVLAGWLLGCTVVTLSGPFYAYPDRGTLTLQIPLFILAGLVYFRDHARVSPRAVLLAAVLLLATPTWYMARVIGRTTFDPDRPAIFLNAEHEAILAKIRALPGPNDLLLSDETSLLWLAPEYPGIIYCGHFFLTVDYERKQREVAAFFAGGPAEQDAFLRAKSVRFLFVDPTGNPDRFEHISGLRLIVRSGAGALFEYRANQQ